MGNKRKKLNVYLDHCCYNRPYDDQAQLRIELETRAKLFVQGLIADGSLGLTVSYMSELENSDNPFEERKASIFRFFENAASIVVESEEIVQNAERFVADGLRPHDALHLACAIAGECDCFLTTDERLLKHPCIITKLMNPVDFVRMWEDDDDDE